MTIELDVDITVSTTKRYGGACSWENVLADLRAWSSEADIAVSGLRASMPHLIAGGDPIWVLRLGFDSVSEAVAFKLRWGEEFRIGPARMPL